MLVSSLFHLEIRDMVVSRAAFVIQSRSGIFDFTGDAHHLLQITHGWSQRIPGQGLESLVNNLMDQRSIRHVYAITKTCSLHTVVALVNSLNRVNLKTIDLNGSTHTITIIKLQA